MTVTTEIRVVVYQGNESATIWPIPFFFYEDIHIRVEVKDDDEEEWTTIPSTVYSVTGNESRNGWVTYPLTGTPLESTKQIRISRVVPFTQEGIELVTSSSYTPELVEREFDLAVMRDQQMRDGVIDVTLLEWNADGTALEDIRAGATVAAAITTFTADGTVGPFTLVASANNTPGFTNVYVAGVKVPGDDYTVVTDTLTFNSGKEPASESPVEVVSYDKIPAEGTFSIAPPYNSMSTRLLQDVTDGLVITPFHFGAKVGDTAANNRANIQEAVNFCFTTFNAPVLDFAGRNWQIDAPIVYTSAPAAWRVLRNGRLTVTTDFSGYIIDIQPGGADVPGNRLNGLTFDGLNFNGGGTSEGQEYATGALKLDHAQGVYIRGCQMQFFAGPIIFGLADRAANEIVVSGCRITGRGANSEGIRLTGNDSDVHGNIIRDCFRGVVFLDGGSSLVNNHIYDNSEDNVLCVGAATLIANNIFDNDPVTLRTFEGAVIGNFFRNSNIRFQPQAANRPVGPLGIMQNRFLNSTVLEVDTTSGTLGDIERFRMVDNIFADGVTPKTSHPYGNAQLLAATSVALDLSDLVPFGTIQHVKASFRRTSGSATPACFASSAGNTVEATLSEAATGRVYFDCDINNFYQG